MAFTQQTAGEVDEGLHGDGRGHGRDRARSLGRRGRGVRRLGHRHAHVDLAGRWPGVDLRHRGPDDQGRRRVAGRLGPRDHRAQPRRRRHPGPDAGRGRSAARSSARAGSRWSPSGPWSASASTARGCPRSARPPRRAGSPPWSTSTPAAYAKRVEAAGDKAFVEAIVYRADEVPESVGDGYEDIPGVLALGDDLPLAPTKEFAAPILGTVGEVTAEMVKDHPDTYQPGDEAGLSGLQAQVRRPAAGHAGRRGRRGRVRRQGARAVPGRAHAGQAAAADPRRATSSAPPSGCSRTSGRRAPWLRSAPRPATSWPPRTGPGNNGYNMATYGQFAPGSTFKSVSTLALLRAGLTPDTVVPCTTTITVDGKTFKNYSDYPAGGIGRIPLRTALANSCNTAFISQAGQARRPGPRRRGRLARPRGRPRPRLPGVLRERRAARVGHRGRGGHDRAGQGARLADGDGDRDRLGAVRVAGRAAAGHLGRRVRPRRGHPGLEAGGRLPARDAARRGDLRERQPAARRTRPAGDRQDRYGGVRVRRARSSPTPG